MKGFTVKDRNTEDSERAQISRRRLVKYAGLGATLVAASPLATGGPAWADDDERKQGKPGDSRNRAWRAGDHHVHSEYSGSFDTKTTPPKFAKGGGRRLPDRHERDHGEELRSQLGDVHRPRWADALEGEP